MKAILVLVAILCASTAMGQESKTVTNSIDMKLVLIQSGSFTMDSPNQVAGRKNESEEISIAVPFFLGASEVTQDEFEKVMGSNPSKFKGSKHPVDRVSWDEATEFCRKLSQLPEEKAAGREYRLPTEIEWVYACRAGNDSLSVSGDTLQNLGDYAWFNQNSEGTSHPVGQKKPNAWGLYDMYGNVSEWCQDVYSKSPSSTAPTNGTDRRQTADTSKNRVARGGGWNLVAGFFHAARRTTNNPSEHYMVVGFRVACRSPEINGLKAQQ